MNKQKQRKNNNLCRGLGIQYFMDCTAFGTGFSDNFPSKNNFSLKDLNEQIEIQNNYITSTIKKESTDWKAFYTEIEEALYDNKIDSNESNIFEFFEGFKSKSIQTLIEEYMSAYQESLEDD